MIYITIDSVFILQHVKMENMDRIVHKIVLRIAAMGYVRMSTDHVTVRKKIMDTLNVINVSYTLRSKIHFAIHVNNRNIFL